MPNIDEAIEALLSYQQADMEGVMVLTSRQAIHEVADELKRVRSHAQGATKPIGFAPYHPKLGWDLARSSHHQADVEAFLEHASQDWEALPLYAAQPPAAPVEPAPLAEPPSALTDDDRRQDRGQCSSAGSVAAAVRKVLATNKWPINRDYDDAGLSEANYIKFVSEVIAAMPGQPQTAPDRVAVQKAVNYLLREGKWPGYKTYDDRGLERAEYTDFVIDVLSALPRPHEKTGGAA